LIVFFGNGRLGNQIFQYLFIKKVRKEEEKAIVFGFKDLREVFEINDITIVGIPEQNKTIKIIQYKIIMPLFRLLGCMRLINIVSVDHKTVKNKYRLEIPSYNFRRGIFSKFTYIDIGYFQSEYFFNKDDAESLNIKQIYIKKAKKLMDDIPKSKYRVFVHVRRGDYSIFTYLGENVLLPESYYRKCLDWFERNKRDILYIFLSDDIEYVKKTFSDINNKIIYENNHFAVDLSIMTLCQSAVLSPSSFGWWGSYLMKEREKVFIPENWLAFSSDIDEKLHAVASYMTEVPVK